MYVYVDGSQVSSVTSTNDADSQITDIFNDINGSLSSTFDVTKFGSSNVHLARKDGGEFTIHCDAPEANLIAIKDSVVDFTDLPSRTKDKFTIKVSGDPSSGTDDYWIRHNNTNDQDVGEWVETVEPGLGNTIDPETMPVTLIRTMEYPFSSDFDFSFAEKRFTLSPIEWTPRVAGD